MFNTHAIVGCLAELGLSAGGAMFAQTFVLPGRVRSVQRLPA